MKVASNPSCSNWKFLHIDDIIDYASYHLIDLLVSFSWEVQIRSTAISFRNVIHSKAISDYFCLKITCLFVAKDTESGRSNGVGT